MQTYDSFTRAYQENDLAEMKNIYLDTHPHNRIELIRKAIELHSNSKNESLLNAFIAFSHKTDGTKKFYKAAFNYIVLAATFAAAPAPTLAYVLGITFSSMFLPASFVIKLAQIPVNLVDSLVFDPLYDMLQSHRAANSRETQWVKRIKPISQELYHGTFHATATQNTSDNSLAVSSKDLSTSSQLSIEFDESHQTKLLR